MGNYYVRLLLVLGAVSLISLFSSCVPSNQVTRTGGAELWQGAFNAHRGGIKGTLSFNLYRGAGSGNYEIDGESRWTGESAEYGPWETNNMMVTGQVVEGVLKCSFSGLVSASTGAGSTIRGSLSGTMSQNMAFGQFQFTATEVSVTGEWTANRVKAAE